MRVTTSQYKTNLWSTHQECLTSRANQVLRSLASEVFKIPGFVCKRFLPSPPHPPSFIFFGLSFSRGQNRKSCSSVFLCSQRSQSNIRKSNPIELQSFDWLRLGSVIKLNQTHPKIFLLEHNRTLKKSNIIRHCMQQSNIKPVSSGFSQKGLRSNKLYIGFNFKHEYPKNCHRGRSENANNSGSNG